jgi:hypothetical protein
MGEVRTVQQLLDLGGQGLGHGVVPPVPVRNGFLSVRRNGTSKRNPPTYSARSDSVALGPPLQVRELARLHVGGVLPPTAPMISACLSQEARHGLGGKESVPGDVVHV